MKPNLAFKNVLAITILMVLCISIISTQEALAVGLKVFVNLSHSKSGSANVCVNSISQNLGCKTVTLSGLASPYTVGPFTFGENVIASGGQFKACATNLANNQYKCVAGTNSAAKVPEYVSITLPGTSGGKTASNQDLKNFCNVVAPALYRSCSDYFFSNGSPTIEGKRGLDCLWGGLSIGLAGLAAGVPLPLVLAGLDLLSGSFNCQEIVRMNVLTTILGQPGTLDQVRLLLGI